MPTCHLPPCFFLPTIKSRNNNFWHFYRQFSAYLLFRPSSVWCQHKDLCPQTSIGRFCIFFAFFGRDAHEKQKQLLSFRPHVSTEIFCSSSLAATIFFCDLASVTFQPHVPPPNPSTYYILKQPCPSKSVSTDSAASAVSSCAPPSTIPTPPSSPSTIPSFRSTVSYYCLGAEPFC